MTEELSRKLYLNRWDAQQETGVTPKQLRQWREAGLMEPELGSRPGRELRFTERDLRLLRVIKRLRDEGYPIETIKKMLGATAEPWAIDFDRWYWDYAEERWLTQREIALRAFATEEIGRTVPDLLNMGVVALLWRSMEDGVSSEIRHQRAREIFDGARYNDNVGTLSRHHDTAPCVQKILYIRSEKLVRGRPEGPQLLEELAGRGINRRGEPWEIDRCAQCDKYFVGEWGEECCSEECYQHYEPERRDDRKEV